MKYELPQEVEVYYILPTLRSLLAQEMIKLGISQTEAGKKLNLTKSAINQYIKQKRANNIHFSKKINNEIKTSACNIAEGSKSNIELYKLLNQIKQTGELCKIHKSLCNMECDFCEYLS